MTFAVTEKGKTMTNREWLMSFTDEQLAEWLCDRFIVRDIEDGFRYTGLSAAKFNNLDSVKGLIEWLREEL